MSEYIKREDAIEAVRKAYVDYIPILYGRTQEIPLKVDMALTNIPSADVVERKRGYWAMEDGAWWCSACGEFAYRLASMKPLLSDFCPNCGADMRGKDDVER